MSTSSELDPTSLLTPSELILLNGEEFASKASWPEGSVDLLHVKTKVSARQLGQPMLAAAFLANEQAGALRLEVGQKKVFLRLFSVTTLFAVPRSNLLGWPAYSLESNVDQLVGKDRMEVSTIIYTWLRHDTPFPWKSAVELVKEGMGRRGLLGVVKAKRLRFFTVNRYVLPTRTAALAAQRSVASIRQLLVACQQTRPEVWDRLEKAGIRPERLQLEWISAAEGQKFAKVMTRLEEIRKTVTPEEIERSRTALAPKVKKGAAKAEALAAAGAPA